MMKKTIFFLMALFLLSCGSKTGGNVPENDSTAQDSVKVADSLRMEAQPEGVVTAPEEYWTEEAVAKQVRKYFGAVNKTLAEDSGLSPFDLDKQYYTGYWNEVYDAVNEKDGKQPTVEKCFFVDDNHWTAGMQVPLEVKDIKVELLTGDNAEAAITLVEKESGFSRKQVLSLDYEKGEWRINNWLDSSKDVSGSILVKMEKYVGK